MSAAKMGQLHNALVKLSREVEEALSADAGEENTTNEATDRYLLELSAVQER